jgi:hypothetical protein
VLVVTRPLRKVLWAAVGIAIAFVVALSFAQVARIDFEQPATTRWIGPVGGGTSGGAGGGTLVSLNEGNYVRGGRHALRLEVWDDGSSRHAVAWAGVMHHMSCTPGTRVNAEGWVYFSSTNAPLTENGAVHLQVEFFRDAAGEDLMPEYVCVSPPVNPTTHAFDQWHRIDIRGRVPDGARSLRAGLIVTAQHLGGRKHAVWVDDLCIELKGRSGSVAKADGGARCARSDAHEVLDPFKSVALCASTGYK